MRWTYLTSYLREIKPKGRTADMTTASLGLDPPGVEVNMDKKNGGLLVMLMFWAKAKGSTREEEKEDTKDFLAKEEAKEEASGLMAIVTVVEHLVIKQPIVVKVVKEAKVVIRVKAKE